MRVAFRFQVGSDSLSLRFIALTESRVDTIPESAVFASSLHRQAKFEFWDGSSQITGA